jgi:hypothetical protein
MARNIALRGVRAQMVGQTTNPDLGSATTQATNVPEMPVQTEPSNTFVATVA